MAWSGAEARELAFYLRHSALWGAMLLRPLSTESSRRVAEGLNAAVATCAYSRNPIRLVVKKEQLKTLSVLCYSPRT